MEMRNCETCIHQSVCKYFDDLWSIRYDMLNQPSSKNINKTWGRLVQEAHGEITISCKNYNRKRTGEYEYDRLTEKMEEEEKQKQTLQQNNNVPKTTVVNGFAQNI